MENSSDIKNLIEFVKDGKLDAVFERLESQIDNLSLKKNLVALHTRYNNLKSKIRQGTLDFNQENAEQNKINASLLEIIYLVEGGSTEHPEDNSYSIHILLQAVHEFKYAKSVTIFTLITILVFIIFWLKSNISIDKKQRLDYDEIVKNSIPKETKGNNPPSNTNSLILDAKEGCDEELLLVWQNALSIIKDFKNLAISQDSNKLIINCYGKASKNDPDWKIAAKRNALIKVATYVRNHYSDGFNTKQAFCNGEISSLQFIEEHNQANISFIIKLKKNEEL